MKASGKSKNLCSLCYKVTACVMSVAFLFSLCLNDVVWAQNTTGFPLLSGSGKGGGQSPDPFSLEISKEEVPLSLGYIREIYLSDTNKPFIVYMQDAHCNYSCQQSIISLIDHFNKKYGIDRAIVEGGQGDYDFSMFTSIPDIEKRQAIVDYFLREGRVTGTEFFAIMNPDRLSVKGLEEKSLYDKNLNVYRESLTYKDEVDTYINILAHYFANLKRHMFSKDIEQFDKQTEEYDDQKIPLKEYVNYIDSVALKKNIDLREFENLSKMLTLVDGEKKIDFDKAQEQRDQVIDLLMERLSKVEVSALVQRSISYKNDDMSPSQFYDYLFGKMRSCSIDKGLFADLEMYKAYLDKYDSLEKDVFFEEIFDIQRYVADNLVSTTDELKLFEMSEDLSILRKMFEVSITRKQYDYLNKKNDQSVKPYIEFVEQKAPLFKLNPNIDPDVAQVDNYRTKIDKFYQCSFDRDKVFIENIEKYSKGQKAVFVVTGGFHTENIQKLLKQAGYSYMVITPKLEQEGYNPYFKLLAGGISPIETVLTAEGSAIALRSIFSNMGLSADRIQISEGIQALSALYDSAEKGTDFTILGFSNKKGALSYIKLSFDQQYKERSKVVGQIMGKPVYALILDAEESSKLSLDDENVVNIITSDIADRSQFVKVLIEMQLIKKEARRKIKDPKTGLSVTDIIRDSLQEQVDLNFKKDGQRIWRKFNQKDILFIGRTDVEDFVEGLLPVMLAQDYRTTEHLKGESNCSLEFVIKELLINAIESIRSIYDEDLYFMGVSEDYDPMIAISLDIDQNDNLVVYVADNGLGQYAADSAHKVMYQSQQKRKEVIAKWGYDPMRYLGGGASAITSTNEIAENTEGEFELLMKNRSTTDAEHGLTIAKFSIPVSKLNLDQAQAAKYDRTKMSGYQQIEQVEDFFDTNLPGVEVTKATKPIISPDPDHDWMSYATYNAGVIEIEGKTFIFFRAHNKEDRISRTGLATRDSSGKTKVFAEGPLIEPQGVFEQKGLEDLRVTRIDVNGVDTLVFVGAAYDGDIARSVMFSISVNDFKNNFEDIENDVAKPFDQWTGWSEHFFPFGDNYGKDGTLFPEKITINGKEKYGLLYRGHSFTKRNEVRLAVSDSIGPDAQWEAVGTVFSAKYPWENFGLGTGPAPIKTEYGWVLIYHAVDGYRINGQDRHNYTAAIVVLDLNDPMKVLYRSEAPFMAPDMEYEQKGFVSNVVFPTGVVVKTNKDGKLDLDLYYGAADDLTGVANVQIDVKRLLELANVKINVEQLIEDGQKQDFQKEDDNAPTILENCQAYTQLQQDAIAKTENVLRPQTKIKVVVETNDNIFWGATEELAQENFKKNLGRYMSKYMDSLSNYEGAVEVVLSNSREQTKEIVGQYDKESDEYSMVVFRLDEFGDVTKAFKEMLQNNKVPVMALNLRPPTLKEGSDKSVIDPFVLLQLAINLDALNREFISDESDQMVVVNAKRNIMLLKSAMELAPLQSFPGSLEALYTGALDVLLPRITDLDINGDIDNWYKALRRIAVSA